MTSYIIVLYSLLYLLDVVDGAEAVLRVECADVVVKQIVSVLGLSQMHSVSGDEELAGGDSSNGCLVELGPVLPADSCGFVDVLEELVTLVRADATGQAYVAVLVALLLTTGYPVTVVHRSAHEDRPVHLVLRL